MKEYPFHYGADAPCDLAMANRSCSRSHEYRGRVDLDAMTNAYLDTAIWTAQLVTDEETGETESLEVNVIDLPRDVWEQARTACRLFVGAIPDASLERYLTTCNTDQLGHDFWLTRNGHGAGFWDRGLGDLGDELTDIAKAEGESDLQAWVESCTDGPPYSNVDIQRLWRDDHVVAILDDGRRVLVDLT